MELVTQKHLSVHLSRPQSEVLCWRPLRSTEEGSHPRRKNRVRNQREIKTRWKRRDEEKYRTRWKALVEGHRGWADLYGRVPPSATLYIVWIVSHGKCFSFFFLAILRSRLRDRSLLGRRCVAHRLPGCQSGESVGLCALRVMRKNMALFVFVN